MSEQTTGYHVAATILTQAKADLIVALPEPIQTGHLLRLTSTIDSMLGPINHAAGLSTTEVQPDTFGPMTNLAAHGISTRTENEPQMVIIPAQAELEALQKKVDDLFPQWETITPAGVADYANTPDGELVVRAIFKRVGMPDYATAPINVETIEKVTRAKELAIKAQEEEALVNKKLEAQKLKQAKAI